MRLHAFRRETRMRQPNGCQAVLFSQIEAHQRFRWIWLPVWQPGEGEHMRRLDRSVFPFDSEGPAEAGAAHAPFAADAQIGLHMRGLKAALGTPPRLALLRAGQRLKDARGWRFDDYFLNDVRACCRHRSSST